MPTSYEREKVLEDIFYACEESCDSVSYFLSQGSILLSDIDVILFIIAIIF